MNIENLKQILIDIAPSTREELREGIKRFCLSSADRVIIEGLYSKTKEIDKTSKELVFTISDIHFPFHNQTMISNYIKCIKDVKPNKIIILGDAIDFYDLSRFDKNPKRVNCLQQEIDMLYCFLLSLRRVAPKAKIIYILGNHEKRLKKFLWKNPELSSLRALRFNELISSIELDVQVVDDSYFQGGIEFSHGTVIRKHSGYSAKAEFDNNRCSGITGHTHRLGSYYVSTSSGVFVRVENGCACDLEPEYVEGTPNWQNGFNVVEFINGYFDIKQVYVHKGSFSYNGVRYS